MFQAFTGSSKKPRQVNLSGKVSNPFATSSESVGPSPLSQNTLANAQAERLQRKHERDRLNGAKLLQRWWRGQTERWRTKDDWRNRWDEIGDRTSEKTQESSSQPWRQEELTPERFQDEDELLEDIRLVLYFANVLSGDDVLRIIWTSGRLRASQPALWLTEVSQSTTFLLRRFQDLCLRTLDLGVRNSSLESGPINDLLASVTLLTILIGQAIVHNANTYYQTLSTVIRFRDTYEDLVDETMLSAAVAPLENISASSIEVYNNFALDFLTTPGLSTAFYKEDSLNRLFSLVNYKILAAAILTNLKIPSEHSVLQLPHRSRAWLLAYFIAIYEQTFSASRWSAPLEDYIVIVSALLSTLDRTMLTSIEDPMRSPDLRRTNSLLSNDEHSAVPIYIHEKIASLVDQQAIAGLLRLIERLDPTQERSPVTPLPAYSDKSSRYIDATEKAVITDPVNLARITAEYILGLIRFFPRRADDIRMWIHLGTGTESQNLGRQSAVQYFFKASARTEIFTAIKQDPKAFLRFAGSGSRGAIKSPNLDGETVWRREWCIILLFLQLYSFVLRVTDDDEFFGAHDLIKGFSLVKRNPSLVTQRTQSRLELDDVQSLIVFLKSLGFALHFFNAELASIKPIPIYPEPGQTKSHRGSVSSVMTERAERRPVRTDSGIASTAPADYVDEIKGLVTGLLRSLYERDSRRQFVPIGGWLMTKYVDMDRFVSQVVQENEERNRIDEEEDREGPPVASADDIPYGGIDLVGTSHTQQQLRILNNRRHFQEENRRRRLEKIAPRLEIMQNMPFFIPFETRVQIFRRFVHQDQVSRRGGQTDPQIWRMMVVNRDNGDGPSQNETLQKHSATIRRGTLLEDAFEHFWKLGDGLKEPISISFIDVHGVEEEGIDGGGVTKEFLTSVTNEALNPDYGLHMFSETANNLLYPNSTAIDERQRQLETIGFVKGSRDYDEGMRVLLQRYEFIGRIIGKCLYEGILVDLAFAPFFLIKWSLTGGGNAASREHGFRASINDIRDLDEELYQGLLQLKNFKGSVEDMGLTFTANSQAEVDGKHFTITQELSKGMGQTPVQNHNRLLYISLLSKYRLIDQQKKQTDAFLKGLSAIIQPMWLSLFNQGELQTLVGGSERQIDVSDLRKNTIYGGLYSLGDDGKEHKSVELFWEVLEAMNEEDKRQVLKFVTSTPRAPLLGFAQLNPAFSIRDGGSDQQRLPTASTCVNLLKLPRYENAVILKRKLLDAVNSGAGFGFS